MHRSIFNTIFTLLKLLPVIAIVLVIIIFIANAGADVMLAKYNNLTANKDSGDKQLQFIQGYVSQTGSYDIIKNLGLATTDEEAEDLYNSMTGQADASTSEDASSVATGDETELAKALALSCCSSNSNAGTADYSQSSGAYREVTWNGVTDKMPRRDCSAFVSTFLRMSGKAGSGFLLDSSGFGRFGSKVDVGATLQVGDVFQRNGHVAVVVKVDDTYAYVGDCGNDVSIKGTAVDGYKYTFKVKDWTQDELSRVWTGFTQIRRPG